MRVGPDNVWFTSVYRNDIYEHLKSLEQQRFIFQRRSPQLDYRCGLIKWMKKLREDLHFCRVTLHLAVFLLDFFMDSHSVKPDKLKLIAFICLVLAGKFEEQEANVPKITCINAVLKSNYIQKDILSLEKKILKFFNWKLTMPTALHFAEYFLNFAIIPEDVCENCASYKYVFGSVKYFVNDFLDCSLEDILLISYPPSFIASSCLLAVRMICNLEPFWPDELKNITNYSEPELKQCSVRILKYKEKSNKQKKRKLDQSSDESPA